MCDLNTYLCIFSTISVCIYVVCSPTLIWYAVLACCIDYLCSPHHPPTSQLCVLAAPHFLDLSRGAFEKIVTLMNTFFSFVRCLFQWIFYILHLPGCYVCVLIKFCFLVWFPYSLFLLCKATLICVSGIHHRLNFHFPKCRLTFCILGYFVPLYAPKTLCKLEHIFPNDTALESKLFKRYIYWQI